MKNKKKERKERKMKLSKIRQTCPYKLFFNHKNQKMPRKFVQISINRKVELLWKCTKKMNIYSTKCYSIFIKTMHVIYNIFRKNLNRTIFQNSCRTFSRNLFLTCVIQNRPSLEIIKTFFNKHCFIRRKEEKRRKRKMFRNTKTFLLGYF